MIWLRAVLTRAVVGQSVHVVLVVVQPGIRVDHFLVTMIVVVVAAAFGVGSEDGTRDRRLRVTEGARR